MIKRKLIFKVIALSLLTILSGCYGDFTYIAGGTGFVDGFATNAKFRHPKELTIDEKTGDLYFVDQEYKVIRKITPDGKVSTIIKEDYLKSPKVKDNYLYFIYKNTIKRLELSKKDAKYEDYLNPNSKNSLLSFHFLSDGTMLLNEIKTLRIVNLNTKEINTLDLKYKTGELLNVGKGITNLGDIPIKENPKTNEIFLFLENRTNSVYKITEDNEIVLQKQFNKATYLSGFDFDNDGNLYTVSSRLEKLIKVSPSGEIKEISNLIGLIDFSLSEKRSMLATDLFFISICLDKKRNILYIAPGEDRIFKIDLSRKEK